MKIEVPECKRCLCCIPLRYGLLFGGYIKLIASFIFLGFIIFLTIITANRIQRLSSPDYPFQRRISFFLYEIIIIVLLTLIVLLDISMNILFIVGGYRKNANLMRVFYYYNIVMLCLFIFGFSVSTTIDLLFEVPYVMRFTEEYPRAAFYIKVKIGIEILFIVIELYFILLTRSEVRKLQNHNTFRFNNVAAEAECKMELGDGHIEPQSNDNSEKMTEIEINDDNVDVVRNDNLNREKDEKLKLNKYRPIGNIDFE